MLSKGQEWKKYESRRKRDKTLCLRCTEAERQQVYKLAKIKNSTIIDLLLSLVNEELKEE